MKTSTTKINGKEIARVPDQNGEYLALNSTHGNAGELYIIPTPGAPKPFTPKWYAWIDEQTRKLNDAQA